MCNVYLCSGPGHGGYSPDGTGMAYMTDNQQMHMRPPGMS